MADVRLIHSCGTRMEVERSGFVVPYTQDGNLAMPLSYYAKRPEEQQYVLDGKAGPFQRGDLLSCAKCAIHVLVNLGQPVYPIEKNWTD